MPIQAEGVQILMEKPVDLLETFSPLLIENHIRMLSIANCIASEDKNKKTTFSITKETYQKIKEYDMQTPLIGMVLQYDDNSQKLSASIDSDLYETYTNILMSEVVTLYKENYFHRYDKFIRCDE